MTDETEPYDVLGNRDGAWDRLENVVEIRSFEGGAGYLADLDGKPCFALNEAVLADFGDEEDRGANYSPIFQFETVEARDAYAGEWLKPFLTRDLQEALVEEFREGKLTSEDFREAIIEIERAYLEE